jgi:hypothetical protein
MTVREAIENALAWIEAKNGHRDGDVYQDLEQAQKTLEVLLEHRDVLMSLPKRKDDEDRPQFGVGPNSTGFLHRYRRSR